MDLYNKEKEKNKELEDERKKYPIAMTDKQFKQTIDNAQKELKEELHRQINTREIEEKFMEDNFIHKDKIREKIDTKFRNAKGLWERGVQPQAQYTMKLLRDLEQELLED